MKNIDRHKTAITRYDMSKPIAMAVQHQIIKKEFSIFDYGCGKGKDVEELLNNGYTAIGWDPAYAPDISKGNADIINLGYVINVIEKPEERSTVLQNAFNLAEKCLIVSAQVLNDGQKSQGRPYSDGILTTQNTFQKYYTQQELRQYIAETLKEEPVPVCPGIFYIFKDPKFREEYLSTKYLRTYIARQRTTVPLSEKLKPHLPLLEKYANLIGSIARIPKPDEIPFYEELITKLGNPKRCLTYCEKMFDNFNFQDIVRNKRDDLIVFLSLSNFSGKLQYNNLPKVLQRDIKAIFGSYKAGIEIATDLLFAVGDNTIVSTACAKSKIGKLLPDALYIHVDYLNSLSPILRIFIGCGYIFAGEFDDATIVKINRNKSKISYLYYDNFNEDPHPKLNKSIVLDLRKLKMNEWDYSNSDNRPILHRKETFVGEDYHFYRDFAELTKKEEEAGLFDDVRNIGREKEWQTLLCKQSQTIINN